MYGRIALATLLIGIVCAKRIGSEIDNMAYAIPSNLAKNLVENIIYYCDGNAKTTVQRPFIGITINTGKTYIALCPDDDFQYVGIIAE